MHNTDKSIDSFARSCFEFALDKKLDLWFSTKDTISKTSDHKFKDANIEYFYTLIDDAVARSEGCFIWTCKNYDGDVMSNLIATAFGSLVMMKSVLVSSDGKFEYEATHGMVQRHYYKYFILEISNRL